MPHLVPVLLVLGATVLAQAEPPVFADPEEAKTWKWLLERAGAREHVERDRNGKLKWVGFYDEEKKRGNFYRGSVTLEGGRVVKMVFNQAHFTNDDLKRIAAFRKLRTLTAWHNWDRENPKNPVTCSGAGLVHLKGTAIESVNFGGSRFNDEGVKAAVQLPTLKELIIYHTAVTDEGVKALADDDHIEVVRLGPQYSLRVTDRSLEPLSRMKALKRLELNETMLSWEGGLKHLVRLKGRLESFACKKGLIAEADLERLRQALPGTKIEYTRAEDRYIDRMKRIAARK